MVLKSQLYGQEKLVNWLIKKIEAIEKELQCKVSKCLKQILRKPISFLIFSILVSKNLDFPLIGEKKRPNLLFRAESNVR